VDKDEGNGETEDTLDSEAQISKHLNAPFTEVLDALRSEDVVVPLPREAGLDETLRGQALHSLNDLKVGNIELLVLRRIVVLLRDENALCKNVR
jgi:hypothetical protein